MHTHKFVYRCPHRNHFKKPGLKFLYILCSVLGRKGHVRLSQVSLLPTLVINVIYTPNIPTTVLNVITRECKCKLTDCGIEFWLMLTELEDISSQSF